MAPQRTFTRQAVQIAESDTHDDTLAAGEATLKTASTHIEYDLNALRSQVKRMLDDSGGNWWDDLPTVNSKKRDFKDLNTDLDNIEEKRHIAGVTVLTDVSVGGAANFVVLGVGELPADTAAVDSGNALGCIVRTHQGTFGQHSLDEVTGKNALSPKNLVKIRDVSTKDAITSGIYEIFGLLQCESGVLDGDTFNTVDKRVMISFVRNDGSDDLEACPAADIQGKTIEYMYAKRVSLKTMPEDLSWPPQHFSDQVATVDVTLDSAIDNQSGPATQTQDIDIDIAASQSWEWRDAASQRLFAILEDSAGSASEVQIGSDVDKFNVDALDSDFAQGVKVGTAKTRPIHLGQNDGLVETTAGNLEVKAAAELILNDTNMVSEGTWTGPGVKVSDSTTEVTAYEAAFGGEVSLMNSVVQARIAAGRTKVQAVMTVNVSAGTDINGPTYHNNCDVDLPPYDQVPVSFKNDVDIYLNGEMATQDAASGGTADFYPGTHPNEGDVKSNIDLKGSGSKPDQLTVVVNGQ